MERVAAIVVAFNSGDALTRCLDSLDGVDVVVVNNGARDAAIEAAAVRERVTVIDSRNDGFGAGANKGAAAADADVLVFLNPDTVARPGAIEALVRRLADASIGIVQARLRLHDRPDLLNSSGNIVHVSGLAWPGGFREPADSLDAVCDIPYASGAAFAVRSDVFRELGGFAEELFLYQEDLDLCWRAHMRGLRVVVDPGADVLHDYVLDRADRRKEYLLERNRLVFVLTAYSTRLLLLLFPVLVAVEVGVTVLALRRGWLREKARGWLWLLRHGEWLRRRRAVVQRLRRVPDRELAPYLTPVVDAGMLDLPRALAPANALVAAWWRVVRAVL